MKIDCMDLFVSQKLIIFPKKVIRAMEMAERSKKMRERYQKRKLDELKKKEAKRGLEIALRAL